MKMTGLEKSAQFWEILTAVIVVVGFSVVWLCFHIKNLKTKHTPPHIYIHPVADLFVCFTTHTVIIHQPKSFIKRFISYSQIRSVNFKRKRHLTEMLE